MMMDNALAVDLCLDYTYRSAIYNQMIDASR